MPIRSTVSIVPIIDLDFIIFPRLQCITNSSNDNLKFGKDYSIE
jgi:hypothetical protein